MKYELHAFASNLSLHNPALKYAEQMDDAGLPYSSPEQAAQDRAKLIVGPLNPCSLLSMCSQGAAFVRLHLCQSQQPA